MTETSPTGNALPGNTAAVDTPAGDPMPGAPAKTNLTRRRRLLWAIPLILLGLLVLAYAVAWFYFAGVVRGRIEAILDRQREEGATVESSSLAVEGFPFDFRVRMAPGAVRRPDGLAIEAALVGAETKPWAWTDINLALRDLRVTANPGEAPGAVPLTVAAAEGAGALTVTRAGDPRALRLTLGGIGVDAGDRRLGAVETATLSAGRRPGEAFDLSVDAGSVTVPVALAEPFGDTLDSVSLDASLTPEPPGQIDADSVQAWKDAGGQIVVERLSVAWGPLTLEASGTLTLDDELQPEGDLTAQVEGLAELADALAAGGIVEPGQASILKAGAGLLSGKPIPLYIRDGAVSLGPFQIPGVALPRIAWPEAEPDSLAPDSVAAEPSP